MKLVISKVYKFGELSKHQREKATTRYYDINIVYEWWKPVFDEARTMGLKILSYNLECSGELLCEPPMVIKTIMRKYKSSHRLYKIVKRYKNTFEKLKDVKTNDPLSEGMEYYEDAEYRLQEDLLKYYGDLLAHKEAQLLSEKAIIKTLTSNGYYFTQEGLIY